MRKSKFAEEQIVASLKLAEASSVDEVCRKIGISRNTFYAWKKKFGGMDVSDARRLKQLEDENRRLHHARRLRVEGDHRWRQLDRVPSADGHSVQDGSSLRSVLACAKASSAVIQFGHCGIGISAWARLASSANSQGLYG
jgi:putative transposase